MSATHSYVCTGGHLDVAPTWGTYASCQVMVPVVINGRSHACPCGNAVVKVPFDETLEAAYRIGGPTATLQVLADRVAEKRGGSGQRQSADLASAAR